MDLTLRLLRTTIIVLTELSRTATHDYCRFCTSLINNGCHGMDGVIYVLIMQKLFIISCYWSIKYNIFEIFGIFRVV